MPALLAAAALAAALAPSQAPRPATAAEGGAARALAAVAAEGPEIEAVQRAAGAEAERGLSAAPGFARRSRAAALLPRLTAEWRHEERSHRVVGLQGSGEVDYLNLAPGTAVVLRATWDLGALVAARGELAAAQSAGEAARRRAEAVRRATALFYERRRALLALLLDPPGTERTRAEAEIDVDRMTAELDALTGGLFTRGGRP